MALVETGGDYWQDGKALAALERIAYLAGTSADLNSLCEGVAAEVMSLFQAQNFSLFTVDFEKRQRSIIYTIGTTDEEQAEYGKVPIPIAPKDDLGKPVSFLITDFPEPLRKYLTPRFPAGASAPLRLRSTQVGHMTIGFVQPRRLSPSELQLLLLIASHIAIAVEVQRGDAERARELGAATSELAKLRADLAHKQRLASLGEWAATVAHEIRNPLGSLANGLSLLSQRAGAPESRAEVLEMMRVEVERIDHLVQDLLEYARPGSLERGAFELSDLLEEVAAATRLHAGSKPVSIELAVAAPLPELNGDLRLLRRMLLNLTSNAVEALGPNGRLVIRAQREGPSVTVALEDDGPGVPESLRDRIFEPFVTGRASGTGLGLALAQRIAQMHGGKIWFEPGRPRGAIFMVQLPASAPA